MSPGAEVLLVAQRELRTNLRSGKGIALLVLSVLGGVLVALGFTMAEHAIQQQAAPPGVEVSPADSAQAVTAAVAVFGLVRILQMTVWLTPPLVALLGFDAISGDLQHRSIRYWSVRLRRSSYYVGKVLGLWVVITLVTSVMHVLVWIVFIGHGFPKGEILKMGSILWLISLPIGLVWCSISSLVGSQFRAPILALLITFATFFVLWIFYVAGSATKATALAFVYPNFFEDWMLADDPKLVIGGLAICLASAAAYIAAGATLFARRDV